jgi:hypothetical protein
MPTYTANQASPKEVAILAHVLGNNKGRLPLGVARYLLQLSFSDEDKARMHDLAVRNQDGLLSPVEKDELLAYARAGSLISILKSRARRSLRNQSRKRATS